MAEGKGWGQGKERNKERMGTGVLVGITGELPITNALFIIREVDSVKAQEFPAGWTDVILTARVLSVERCLLAARVLLEEMT